MESQKYITFFLNGEEYGISSDYVREILRKPEYIREIPNMPSYMTGIMMIREEIVPIIDLKKRYHLDSKSEKKGKIVIIQENNNIMAILVDDVEDIVEISEENIQLIDGILKQNHFNSVNGIGKVNGRYICLIQVADLVNDMTKREIKEVV